MKKFYAVYLVILALVLLCGSGLACSDIIAKTDGQSVYWPRGLSLAIGDYGTGGKLSGRQ